jgi:hypothetical protein
LIEAPEIPARLAKGFFGGHSGACVLGCHESEIAVDFLVQFPVDTFLAEDISKEGV